MKKTFLILLSLVSFIGLSQSSEKIITEFNTSHANVGMGANKMPIKFELYESKLVMHYLDKSTIKTMKKSGMDPFLEFPYKFSKESNNLSEWYKYQDEKLQIMVILKGNPTPSVTIKTKDSFTGKTTEQAYFSM